MLLGAILLGLDAKAQVDTTSHSAQQSVQLNLGSQGIGAEFLYGLSSRFTLRAGANIIPVKANNVFKISDFNSNTEASADFTNIHALADYSPFSDAGAFRFVAGLAYFLKAEGNIRVTPSDSYSYGDLQLSKEQVGHLDLNVDWKGVAPYFGIAIGHAFPRKKFNVNLDLGGYYLSAPKADIKGTGLLSGNDSQTGQFQSNIKDYRLLPVMQLNFNFKL